MENQIELNPTLKEAFFWKHLADTLLEDAGIDQEAFYAKVEGIREFWEQEEEDKRDTNLLLKQKTILIKDDLRRAIFANKPKLKTDKKT